nr:basic salivary proline-rich protein 4-like [Macaca nemestrina]
MNLGAQGSFPGRQGVTPEPRVPLPAAPGVAGALQDLGLLQLRPGRPFRAAAVGTTSRPVPLAADRPGGANSGLLRGVEQAGDRFQDPRGPTRAAREPRCGGEPADQRNLERKGKRAAGPGRPSPPQATPTWGGGLRAAGGDSGISRLSESGPAPAPALGGAAGKGAPESPGLAAGLFQAKSLLRRVVKNQSVYIQARNKSPLEIPRRGRARAVAAGGAAERAQDPRREKPRSAHHGGRVPAAPPAPESGLSLCLGRRPEAPSPQIYGPGDVLPTPTVGPGDIKQKIDESGAKPNPFPSSPVPLAFRGGNQGPEQGRPRVCALGSPCRRPPGFQSPGRVLRARNPRPDRTPSQPQLPFHVPGAARQSGAPHPGRSRSEGPGRMRLRRALGPPSAPQLRRAPCCLQHSWGGRTPVAQPPPSPLRPALGRRKW